MLHCAEDGRDEVRTVYPAFLIGWSWRADALFEEASSVGFQRSVVYGLSTMRVVLRYMLHRLRIRRSPKLKARRPAR